MDEVKLNVRTRAAGGSPSLANGESMIFGIEGWSG
jgi:hypothetical protein